MRIANQTIVRNYTGNINDNLSRLNMYNSRITTQRRFASMAEDPSSGVRALQIRRNMSRIESQQETTKTLQSQLKSAESQMLKISDLGQEIASKYNLALNGTSGPDERNAIKSELLRYQEEILACANGQFSGRYMFGGTNTTERPFTVDSDGMLLYNNIKVADIDRTDPQYKHLFNDAAFVDIGLGFEGDADYNLVESSAFKSTKVGLEFMGWGEKNIYDLCTTMVKALDDPEFHDGEPFSGYLDDMHTAYKDVTLDVTKLGADTQFLDYTAQRLSDDLINLKERQDAVEAIDPYEAIMQLKMQDYVYNAALQMGQRLLQPSLFSFIS